MRDPLSSIEHISLIKYLDIVHHWPYSYIEKYGLFLSKDSDYYYVNNRRFEAILCIKKENLTYLLRDININILLDNVEKDII